ncbi:SGNH/GDSL hydrolase family protein [Eubacteriales bacterium OttesenSCG-928-N13]|nr:SGNH/GDSL hydrolase family protein [Eubacteriales bacterium OttesenSCG-928-N13]
MKSSEILILGDSVFKGVVFDNVRQRYTLLKDGAVQMLSSLLPLPIVNRSQMGRTAPEGLQMLQNQDPSSLKNRVVVLEFGGNDCDFNWRKVAEQPDAPHTPNTDEDAFQDALYRMIARVRDCGGRPILSTLPPLDPYRYLDWITRDGLSRENILRFLGRPERIYRWQEYYSSMILHVSAETLCECVPIREAFLSQVRGEDVLCEDGIHPNKAGHKIIADAALQFAGNLLGDPLLARA